VKLNGQEFKGVIFRALREEDFTSV
jgi:hypothetical protein